MCGKTQIGSNGYVGDKYIKEMPQDV